MEVFTPTICAAASRIAITPVKKCLHGFSAHHSSPISLTLMGFKMNLTTPSFFNAAFLLLSHRSPSPTQPRSCSLSPHRDVLNYPFINEHFSRLFTQLSHEKNNFHHAYYSAAASVRGGFFFGATCAKTKDKTISRETKERLERKHIPTTMMPTSKTVSTNLKATNIENYFGAWFTAHRSD